MVYIDNPLMLIALIFKKLNLPHFLKYGFFLFLKKKKIMVRSSIKISNAKMDLNLGNFIDYWIFMDGSYEERWIRKAMDLVKGKVLIDVGASIGIYSLSLFREAKLIYAFEAEEKNYKRLVSNLKINSAKNVRAFRKIISDQDGELENLFINNINEGMHSSTVSYGGGVQKVYSLKLDSFINRHKIRNLGLIKIDVEGAELKVLEGLHNTLKKIHPPVLLELNKTLAELSGHKTTDIYKLMVKNRYKPYGLRKNQLIRLNDKDISRIYSENVLFKSP